MLLNSKKTLSLLLRWLILCIIFLEWQYDLIRFWLINQKVPWVTKLTQNSFIYFVWVFKILFNVRFSDLFETISAIIMICLITLKVLSVLLFRLNMFLQSLHAWWVFNLVWRFLLLLFSIRSKALLLLNILQFISFSSFKFL